MCLCKAETAKPPESLTTIGNCQNNTFNQKETRIRCKQYLIYPSETEGKMLVNEK
jgi:hypothetical protein